ncbi:MAG: MFS transporter [Cyclobacteriaceae bacterium]|jgi:MFS family permease
MNTPQSTSTNWKQIYSLMALNAAIVLSWIAYHNYQPKVLEIFHFQELSFFLVIAQALILVFIPPLAGIIADRVIQSGGNRFVVFTVGISVTAMVFMCVAFTIGTATTINLTSALPFMIVVWLISMNIFHSPANSMLELFAPAKELPAAMAMMVITTELLYAFEPLIVGFVDTIGPVPTFALGGVLLIVTGYFFKTNTRSLSLVREYHESKNTRTDFFLVLAAGLVLGLATALFKNYLPQKMENVFEAMRHDGIQIAISGSMVISFGLVVAALAAWPFSKLVDRIGTEKSLQYGLAGAFIVLLPSFFIGNVYALIMITLLTAPFISYATVAGFPYALGKLSAKNVTLGAGIFFGSVELADGIMNIWINKP